MAITSTEPLGLTWSAASADLLFLGYSPHAACILYHCNNEMAPRQPRSVVLLAGRGAARAAHGRLDTLEVAIVTQRYAARSTVGRAHD
jgi:hypothetical protein